MIANLCKIVLEMGLWALPFINRGNNGGGICHPHGRSKYTRRGNIDKLILNNRLSVIVVEWCFVREDLPIENERML